MSSTNDRAPHERLPAAVAWALIGCSLAVAAGLSALAAWHYSAFSEKLAAFDYVARTQPVVATEYRTFPFRYHGRTRFVAVPVDADELRAARELDASAVFSTVGPLRAGYVRALVRSQARSRTVGVIAAQLFALRTSMGLDSDEYLELIARFVQEIPYGKIDTEVRLPAEIVASGSGVCDDKSVLLAALLVHEGYDTAVWAFDSQAHAAVGVRGLGSGMLGSGYAFIETTRPSYVGQMGGTLGSYAEWRREPQLVRVGGSRRYRSDLEAAFVAGALERARRHERRLSPYLRYVQSAPPRWEPAYRSAALRQTESGRLAALISASSDERERLFELLTRSGGR